MRALRFQRRDDGPQVTEAACQPVDVGHHQGFAQGKRMNNLDD